MALRGGHSLLPHMPLVIGAGVNRPAERESSITGAGAKESQRVWACTTACHNLISVMTTDDCALYCGKSEVYTVD